MKASLFFLCVFIPSIAFAQDTIKGIGILALSDEGNEVYDKFFHLFNEDGTEWHAFSFYYDDTDGQYPYLHEEFSPIAFHPDYFLLKFTCLAENDTAYLVIANESTGLTRYLRKDVRLKLLSYEVYVLSARSVGFDRDKNPLLDQPEGNPVQNPGTKIPLYKSIEVQGDWLRVKQEEDEEERNAQPAQGWVRWRKDGKIIIELYFLC